MNITLVHQAISAVCPIEGVSTDGRIDFLPAATPQQKTLAKAIFNNWDDTKVTYIQQRIKSYPSILDQLDMIYQDKVNNTNTWVQTITAVKQQFPKPA